jgi:hypothetical protein
MEAKLSGQIETGQKSLTINLRSVSPEEALEYARDILEFFGSGAVPNGEDGRKNYRR